MLEAYKHPPLTTLFGMVKINMLKTHIQEMLLLCILQNCKLPLFFICFNCVLLYGPEKLCGFFLQVN